MRNAGCDVSQCPTCGGHAKFPMGGESRRIYGCIVTFRNSQGKTLSIHREGAPTKALKQAIAIALSHDETFKVISVSSPETIYRDLQGSREHLTGRSDGEGARTPVVAFPELSKVPAALLDDSLRYGGIHPSLRDRRG